MKGYQFDITRIENPTGCGGVWFEYKVTHVETGIVSPEGKCRAVSEGELLKTLERQVMKKLRDPRFSPPVNGMTDNDGNKIRNYILGMGDKQ